MLKVKYELWNQNKESLRCEANLDKANLTEANLNGIYLRKVVNLDKAIFSSNTAESSRIRQEWIDKGPMITEHYGFSLPET